MSKKLMRAYFDFVYNPMYDLTVARLKPYQIFQKECIDKLQFKDGDSVLCVGVGTGNEIVGILERNRNVSIVGLDTSPKALRRACRKAVRIGNEITCISNGCTHPGICR